MTVDVDIALAAIGAGIAMGMAGVGSGIGVGIAGAAGAGTIAEDPTKFGIAIIFQALPQTQAIYGLLTSILILLGTGLIARAPSETFNLLMGLASLGAGLAVGVAGLSAIGQGIASASGIGATAEKSEMFGRGMVFSVLPETQAIYGLLVAILLMASTGILGKAPTGTPELYLFAGLASLGAGLAIGLAGLSGIGQGIASASGIGATLESREMFGRGMVFSVLPETQAIYAFLIAILLMTNTGILGAVPEISDTFYMVGGFACIGAGAAIGLAGLSGIGQGIAAASGIGATKEISGMFGRGMVFSVLPETQAIYGLLVAILLMVLTGVLGGVGKEIPPLVGLAVVGAGISVGLAGLSGIGQGITAAGGIGAAAKEPGTMGKSLVLSVMSETFAIFGLLIAILIMYGVGLFA